MNLNDFLIISFEERDQSIIKILSFLNLISVLPPLSIWNCFSDLIILFKKIERNIINNNKIDYLNR